MPQPDQCSFCEKPATMQCTDECDEQPLFACDDHSYCDPISCVWRCESCALHYEEIDTDEELNRGPHDTLLRRWGPTFWGLVDGTSGDSRRLRKLLESSGPMEVHDAA